jgi:serine/threonine protein kinase
MNLIEVKAGTLLNSRYRVLCEIQRGGTAIVLRAQDEKDHRLVALKCMSVNTHEAVPMRVVEAEIAFCSSVKSPSFVKLYDLFNHGHMLVIVMELVDGPDLLDLLNSKGGSISEPEALFYVHQLAQAAEIMHQHGFAHRDIKPENSVLILSTHQLKMIDFGE